MTRTMIYPHRWPFVSVSRIRDERGFGEVDVTKKRALERWENEGGKIPELFSAADRTRSARANPDAGGDRTG